MSNVSAQATFRIINNKEQLHKSVQKEQKQPVWGPKRGLKMVIKNELGLLLLIHKKNHK